MKGEIEEIIVKGETIYLKKDFLGWGIVYPVRNKDNSINWKHLLIGGSWVNFFLMAIIILIFMIFFYEAIHNLQILLDCFDNPVNLNTCIKSFGGENMTGYSPTILMNNG